MICPYYILSAQSHKKVVILLLTIETSTTSSSETINYKEDINGWTKIGTYILEADNEISFTLTKEDQRDGKPLIADAIMLVPIKK